jgi:hypothetical protein
MSKKKTYVKKFIDFSTIQHGFGSYFYIHTLKLVTFKSWHFKVIFKHFMGLLSGHLVWVKTSIYQNINR